MFACNLCHGLMTAAQSLVATPCGHLYHSICVNTYFEEKDLENRPICPCCRYELNEETGLITLHPIPFKRSSSPPQQVTRESRQETISLRSGACGSGDVVRTFVQDRLDRILSQTQAGSHPLPQSYSIDVQRTLLEADDVLDARVRERDSSPVTKVSSDVIFMMDGKVVNIDQVLPSSSNKLAQRSGPLDRRSLEMNVNDGRERPFSKQNVVIPERSSEPLSQVQSIPRNVHEPQDLKSHSQGGNSFAEERGMDMCRSPVKLLPPAPSSSSSMWGTPSWQMGAPSRVPVSGSSGNNVHRMDNVQYYPSPFIREPVKQQPPFSIQIPFHRPTGQDEPTPKAVNSLSTLERYEGSNFPKRKASSFEEQGHGGPRPNIETIIINDERSQHNEHTASTSAQAQAALCKCCNYPPPHTHHNLGGEHQNRVAAAQQERLDDQEQG